MLVDGQAVVCGWQLFLDLRSKKCALTWTFHLENDVVIVSLCSSQLLEPDVVIGKKAPLVELVLGNSCKQLT